MHYTYHGFCTEISGSHSDKMIMVFRDVTPNILADKYQHFGGTFCMHLQGRRRRSRFDHKVGSCLQDEVGNIIRPLCSVMISLLK
jgi:hypothetical protein